MAKIMIEVARHPRGFVLYERPHKSGPDWRNYKLMRPNGRRKRNWVLGCNGIRLCENRDMQLLRTYEPTIYRWLVLTLVIYRWEENVIVNSTVEC